VERAFLSRQPEYGFFRGRRGGPGFGVGHWRRWGASGRHPARFSDRPRQRAAAGEAAIAGARRALLFVEAAHLVKMPAPRRGT